MSDWIERVKLEKQALDQDLKKLEAFCSSPDIEAVDQTARELLLQQYFYMMGYSQTLGERLMHAAVVVH